MVLSNNLLNALPFAVVTASLLGSPHCVGMCGGLILSVSKSKVDIILYHLARLLGYFALGAFAGLIGKHAFHSPVFSFLPWIASTILSIGFILSGFHIWKGKAPHLFRMPTTFFSYYQKVMGRGPMSTGLLTAFLPCGWLHTFVLGALATGSPWSGGLYLAFFWLGTLPALILAPATLTTILKPLFRTSPKLSAILLICFGFFSIAVRLIPVHSGHSCH